MTIKNLTPLPHPLQRRWGSFIGKQIHYWKTRDASRMVKGHLLQRKRAFFTIQKNVSYNPKEPLLNCILYIILQYYLFFLILPPYDIARKATAVAAQW